MIYIQREEGIKVLAPSTPGPGHLQLEDSSHNVWLWKLARLYFRNIENHQGLTPGALKYQQGLTPRELVSYGRLSLHFCGISVPCLSVTQNRSCSVKADLLMTFGTYAGGARACMHFFQDRRNTISLVFP